jgi:RNA polymerase sigma-70 factor (ECF subfamily)
MSSHAGIQLLDVSIEVVFERVFKANFKALHAYVFTILRDEAAAEEIVQNVFYKLWEKKDSIQINQSVTAYLYRSVYNDSLNHLKHIKVKSAYKSYINYSNGNNATEEIKLRELEERLDAALRDLPEQCRTIFQMSRYEELKYQEIADRLQLSVKTVENQMGKALKILRIKLKDFLPHILLLMLNL